MLTGTAIHLGPNPWCQIQAGRVGFLATDLEGLFLVKNIRIWNRSKTAQKTCVLLRDLVISFSSKDPSSNKLWLVLKGLENQQEEL